MELSGDNKKGDPKGHPNDDEIYPVGTTVRLLRTGEFAKIESQTFQKDGRGFLHYLGKIEGRGDGLWCLMHTEIDLECLP